MDTIIRNSPLGTLILDLQDVTIVGRPVLEFYRRSNDSIATAWQDVGQFLQPRISPTHQSQISPTHRQFDSIDATDGHGEHSIGDFA